MATRLIYSSDTAITFDISSLAGDTDLLAGYECSEIDNTSNRYTDVLVFVKGILGHAITAPTVGQLIELYLWGSKESLATTAIDTLVGANGSPTTRTLTHLSVKQSLRLVSAPPVTVATANLKYWIQPFNVATFFDGVVPPFWGLFLTHNHTGALAASQSALFSYQGIKREDV